MKKKLADDAIKLDSISITTTPTTTIERLRKKAHDDERVEKDEYGETPPRVHPHCGTFKNSRRAEPCEIVKNRRVTWLLIFYLLVQCRPSSFLFFTATRHPASQRASERGFS